MSDKILIAIVIVTIAAVGLLAVLISGREFAGPLGGGIGFALGVIIAIVQTIQTPKQDRKLAFSAWVGNGLPGGRRREDGRFVMVFALLISCGFSAAVWQIILKMVRS